MFKHYSENLKGMNRNIVLFIIGAFFMGIGMNFIWLLFNLFMESLGYRAGIISDLLSLRTLGSVIIGIPASYIIIRGNLKNKIIASSVLSSLAFILLSQSSSTKGIGFSIFSIGLFSAIYMIAAGPFFMKYAKVEQRPFIFGINSAVHMGSGIIGSVVGGFFRDYIAALLNSDIAAYRYAMLVGAFFVFLSIIPFSKIQVNEEKKIKTKSTLQFIKEIDLLLTLKLLIPPFLVGIGAGITIPFINLYYRMEWGLTDSIIGVIFGFGQVFTFLGMILSPIISNKFTKVKTIVGTQLLSIPFMIFIAFSGNLYLIVIAFLIRQALMNMNSPVNDHFLMEMTPPQHQPLLNSLKMISWNGSWMIAVKFGGDIIERYSFKVSFLLTASVYLLATILFYMFFHKEAI